MSDSKNMPFNFAVNINTQDETTGETMRQQNDDTFSIAILGDFGGGQDGSDKTSIGERAFIEIDRYNYDEVLADGAAFIAVAR